jgi:hypothetical protein
MERRAANTLRILAIVATALIVIVVCGVLLYLALFLVMMGALTEHTMILHPQGANFVYGAILATFALVAVGVIVIGRLATGIIRGRNASQVPARLIPSPSSRYVQLHLSSAAGKTIDRLVLALGAQILVTTITVFQRASGPLVPHGWALMLVIPFVLVEIPDAILIYVLLKRPGRAAFTFLIAMLIFPVLQALFNPLVFIPYRQIFRNPSMGAIWLVLSELIYLVTVVLAYLAIRQTGLRPRPAPAILATVATSFYFLLVTGITPYLYRLWI